LSNAARASLALRGTAPSPERLPLAGASF